MAVLVTDFSSNGWIYRHSFPCFAPHTRMSQITSARHLTYGSRITPLFSHEYPNRVVTLNIHAPDTIAFLCQNSQHVQLSVMALVAGVAVVRLQGHKAIQILAAYHWGIVITVSYGACSVSYTTALFANFVIWWNIEDGQSPFLASCEACSKFCQT